MLRAGEGTRTLDNQLGRLELYQLSYTRNPFISIGVVLDRPGSCRIRFVAFGRGTGWWREVDSNLRRHEPADPSIYLAKLGFLRAGGGTRTRDLLITSQVLYRLSYASRIARVRPVGGLHV